MSFPTSEILVSLISMAVGWLCLWPMRNQLGRFGYHAIALPVGVLGWSVVAGVSSVFGRPFDAASAVIGLALFVAMLRMLQRVWVPPSDDWDSEAGLGSFGISAGILVATSGLLGLAGLSIASGDSWAAYWLMAVRLGGTGALQIGTFASRGVPLVSLGAANILFGGGWAYVLYSLFAINLVVILGALLISDVLPRVGRGAGLAISAGTLALLGADPTFLYNLFYVHSHGASALYMLISLGALRMAVTPETRRPASSAGAWLFVSGLSTAGLALVRPDGLVYAAVPVVLVLSVVTDKQWAPPTGAAAFFAPLLGVLYTVYAAAYYLFGLWPSNKLTGVTAFAILAALALAAVIPRAIKVLEARLPYKIGGQRLLAIAVLIGMLALLPAFALRWSTAYSALAHARINLFTRAGGWGPLWYLIAVFLVLTLASGDALRPNTWARPLFLSIVLFFCVSALVFGTSHGGRVGYGDSFNRVAFHIVPIIVWYVGLVVARVVGDMRRIDAERRPPVAL